MKGVADEINKYVFADESVPAAVLTKHYSDETEMPLPLVLYDCSKRNVSTPTDMWLRALPDLKVAFEEIANAKPAVNAILLDNFPKTLSHALAAEETFGRGFPSLAIDVSCPEHVAEARFTARARGADDVSVFRRRFARHAKGSGAVVGYYERMGLVVQTDALGDESEAYGKLIRALDASSVWLQVTKAGRGILAGGADCQ